MTGTTRRNRRDGLIDEGGVHKFPAVTKYHYHNIPMLDASHALRAASARSAGPSSPSQVISLSRSAVAMVRWRTRAARYVPAGDGWYPSRANKDRHRASSPARTSSKAAPTGAIVIVSTPAACNALAYSS